MQIIPLQAEPSQTVNAQLGGQSCAIAVYQLDTGLFFDLTANGVPIVSCQLCLNANRLVRDAYLGFIGDMVFLDTQGSADPTYTGLGTRFSLAYLDATDLATLTVI